MDKTFDLFSFNVRGLSSQKAKLIEICNLTKKLSKNKKYFVLLQETKLEKMKEELNKILKYHNLEYVMTPAYQNSGGLLILFPKNSNIEVLGKTRCSLVVFDKESKIVIMNIYINPKDYSLEMLKASIEELKLTHDYQILMAGDLNFINPSYTSSNNIKPKSIIKPNDIRILRYKKFVPVKSSLLLIDLALLLQNIGPTHVDKRLGNHSRIDYIFSNITKFSVDSHKLDLIPFTYSDHKGLHLYELNHTEIVQPLWKLDKNVLERSESVNDILQQAKTASSKFGNIVSCHDIFKAKVRDCLKTLSVNIKRSEEIEILDIQNSITKIEKLLQNTQNVIHPESREKQWKNLSELEQKLQKIKNIENNKFAKQIKGFFREANEGNPKMTKLLAKNIALDKEIKKIEKQDGSLTEDPNEIIDEFFKFYKTLSQPKFEQSENISKTQQKYIDRFFRQKRKSIKDIQENFPETNESDTITEFEVERAISKLNQESAPGSDGLTSSLYVANKSFFVPYLTDLFNEIHFKKQVPPSFKHAIIKIIPKKNDSIKVSEFRPISLINSDQKILSTVLAERIKPRLDILLGCHQNAHLPNRNIHIAIQKIQNYAHETSVRESIVAIDFSKAFDCIERSFLRKIIIQSPFDEFTEKLIALTYDNTSAFIGMRIGISERFQVERGVRQGCPLSALIFNLCLEPLLQRIQKTKHIKSKQQTKCIAYADDVTISLFNKSIRNLLLILQEFYNVAGLEVNLAKTEVLSKAKKIFGSNQLKRVESTKILGIYFSLKKSINYQTNQIIENTIIHSDKYIQKTSSLRARAKNIETFILSKIMFHCRHLILTKNFLKKINSKIVDMLWLHKKHNVHNETLNLQLSKGGINLKNTTIYYLANKIMNLKFLAFNPKEEHFIQKLKSSKTFRKIALHLTKHNMFLNNFAPSQLNIQNMMQSLELTKQTTSKDVYFFLTNATIQVPPFNRVGISAIKQNVTPDILFNTLMNLWKNKILQTFDKNYLYCFIMNSYLEKQEKWLKNLSPHPLCFGCETKFETWDHLMFECPLTQPISKALNIKNWKDVWLDKSCRSQKFLVSLLLASWTESCGPYLHFFLDRAPQV